MAIGTPLCQLFASQNDSQDPNGSKTTNSETPTLVEALDTMNTGSAHGHNHYEAPARCFGIIFSNSFLLALASVSFFVFAVAQTIFAIAGHSDSMLGDSLTMFIDVVTYLANMYSERRKGGLSTNWVYIVRGLFCKTVNSDPKHYPRATGRTLLILETFSPAISLFSLLSVTIYIVNKACATLKAPSGATPNIQYMLCFSSINLLIDFVNIGAFYLGAPSGHDHHEDEKRKASHPSSHALCTNSPKPACYDSCCSDPSMPASAAATPSTAPPSPAASETGVVSVSLPVPVPQNLNMFSAHTHLMADTLRSVSVFGSGLLCLTAGVDPSKADAWGAIVIGVIIAMSSVPLVTGLYYKLKLLRQFRPESNDTDALNSSGKGGGNHQGTKKEKQVECL